MSDSQSNSQHDVLARRDGDSQLAKENAELRRRLAEAEQNVVQGGFAGEAPRYLLNEPVFIDDTLFERGSTIETFETPNLYMVPLNEPAKRKVRDQIEFQEHGARMVAMSRGRQFMGLVTDRGVLLETAMADAKADASAPVPVIQMPVPIGEVPAMPHTVEAQARAKRGPGRPAKVLSAQAPGPQKPDLGAPKLAPVQPNGPAVVGRMAG